MHDKGVLVELVADELMKQAGRGVSPIRLARMRVLRDLAAVDPSLSPVTTGRIMERYLEEGVDSLPERSYSFKGKVYPASTIKEALRIQLAIGTKGLAPARQCRLMLLLGMYYSYDYWRHEASLQRGLLTILAEHLVNQTAK